MATIRRRTLGLGVAGALLGQAACTGGDAASGDTAGHPLLIKYGHDVLTADQMHELSATIATRPFDGYVVHLEEASFGMFSRIRLRGDDLAAGSGIPDLGSISHNFARVVLLGDADMSWEDDILWETIATNFRDLAAALKDSRRAWDGIFLDLEWYGEPTPNPFDYGATHAAWTFSATEGALPGMSVEDACRLVRSRGRQLMAGATAGWDGITIITTFGPWVSDPATARELSAAGIPRNDVAWANELVGPLTVGMAAAARGTASQWVDGAEVYSAMTRSDFRAVSEWVRTGWAGQDTVVLPEADREEFMATTSAALPVYDRSAPGHTLRSARAMEALVANAMAETDRYAWLYTETHDWLGGRPDLPAVPDRYVAAVERARADVRAD